MRPGAYTASMTTMTGNIGVIGTEGTINSGFIQQCFNEYNPKFKVIGKACPLFVPLVEEGLLNDSVTDEIASRYFKDSEGIACRHPDSWLYPLSSYTQCDPQDYGERASTLSTQPMKRLSACAVCLSKWGYTAIAETRNTTFCQ